jgi:hypothetical protein
MVKFMRFLGYVPQTEIEVLSEKIHILKVLCDADTCALSRKAVKRIFNWG